MKPRALWTTVGWIFALVVAVLGLHASYLNKGFFNDDWAFLGPAAKGIYGCNHATLLDFAAFWNPERGWFYRPVFLTFFALGLHLWGENPVAFHAASLCLHTAVVGLFGLLVFRWSRNWKTAVACGTLFLLWPGKNEAIWWIASGSTLWAALFYLLTLHFWMTWCQVGGGKNYGASIVCFGLALCSKNDAASLPGALLVIAALQASERNNWRIWLRWIGPFLVVFALWLWCETTAARFYALHGDTQIQRFYGLSFASRFHSATLVLYRLWLGILPLLPVGWGSVATLWILGAQIRRWQLQNSKTSSSLLFFAIWSVLAALPVALVAPTHTLSERFAYLPLLPVAGTAVFFVKKLWHCLRQKEPEAQELALWLLVAVSGAWANQRDLEWDVALTWSILFFVIAGAFVMWRATWLSSGLLVVVTLVALGTQLERYAFPDAPLWISGGWRFTAVLGSGWGASGARILLALSAWTAPVFTLPVLIVGEIASRWRGKPHI